MQHAEECAHKTHPPVRSFTHALYFPKELIKLFGHPQTQYILSQTNRLFSLYSKTDKGTSVKVA